MCNTFYLAIARATTYLFMASNDKKCLEESINNALINVFG